VPTQAQFGPRRCGAVGGSSLRLMRLRLSNPALIPDLVEFLRSRADVVAEEVSDDEVEVSLLAPTTPTRCVWSCTCASARGKQVGARPASRSNSSISVLTRTCARRGGSRADTP